MNTVAWGPYSWNFNHNLAWLFPNEVLSYADTSAVIMYCHYFVQIIPCIYCSVSATAFQKKFGLLKSLLQDVNGKLILTRAMIAKYWYEFHNVVNTKLEQPMYKTTWRDTVASTREINWMDSFWVFAYSVCWNYPETKSENEEISDRAASLITSFFGYCIPRVLKHTKLGRSYIQALYQFPLVDEVFISRSAVTRWIYNIRISCSDVMGNPWSYRDLDDMMEAFRARKTNCSEPQSEKNLLDTLSLNIGCQ